MSAINRQVLIKTHLVIAAFIFPAAIMFAITGAFYAWGIKGSYVTESHELELQQPLTGDKNPAVAVILTELQDRGFSLPTGKAKIKSAGTSWYLEWTGSNLDVTLEPTTDVGKAVLKIKTTTWYRHFVQLHKAKGGQLFKAYAALFAVILLALLVSGFLMAWQMPRYRRTAMLSALVGAGVFAMVASIS